MNTRGGSQNNVQMSSWNTTASWMAQFCHESETATSKVC